ncbi:MAG TPA: DUF6390 family protein [Candidatus Limnocylindrales bacterium]|nr:DUF6390 family protein [Candidatus Limnocylindrales bacterium]
MLTQASSPGSIVRFPGGNPETQRPTGPPSGPVLFARYAFGPNRLGYCGPEAVDELFAEGASGGDDRALRGLARSFEGAWPYLELIAQANGIADPLDRRVVEAYWLGSPLLEKVGADLFGASLSSRFRPRLRPEGWRWLAGKPGAGAVPVHAFHVLDVFPRVGLLRSGSVDRALEVMDSCRIRWGRVLERDGEWLVVNVVPLLMVDGRLVLGSGRTERVQGWRDGAGFVDGVTTGDIISIHWSWACDRLSPGQLSKLIAWTSREIAIANLTI